jgi:hypothetical protein
MKLNENVYSLKAVQYSKLKCVGKKGQIIMTDARQQLEAPKPWEFSEYLHGVQQV